MAKKKVDETLALSADNGFNDGNYVVDNSNETADQLNDNVAMTNNSTDTNDVAVDEPVVKPITIKNTGLAKGDRSEELAVNDDLADSDPRTLYDANYNNGGDKMDVSQYTTFSSVDLSGAVPTGVEAPKEVIRGGKDIFWKHGFVWDKTAGASFTPGEFCMRRIYMNPDYIDDDKWVNDFQAAVTPTPLPVPNP